MSDTENSPGGLQVIHQVSETAVTVRIRGPLTFPDAVSVTGVMKEVIEDRPAVVLLDLTDIEKVDATGLAVLVGVGGDLKNAGIQVRLIAADPRLLHRLPYTLGLRKVFPTVEAAMRYQP